jgi:hypothetical protein
MACERSGQRAGVIALGTGGPDQLRGGSGRGTVFVADSAGLWAG